MILTRPVTLPRTVYSAPIVVDVQYYHQGYARKKEQLEIGRLPIMLRSDKCHLAGKSPAELAELGECYLDPGMSASAYRLCRCAYVWCLPMFYPSASKIYHVSLFLLYVCVGVGPREKEQVEIGPSLSSSGKWHLARMPAEVGEFG